jgi:5-methylcytosine-specific restriction endonuclease McrA
VDEKTGCRSKRRTWHPECVYDYHLHSRLEAQFRHVEARDGLKCAWPGCGASPERWHNLGEVTVWVPLPAFGLSPADPAYMVRLREWREANPCPVYCQIERRTALQLDHRVPLWSVADLPDHERRAYFGPSNLWLLCPTHHGAKTRREAQARAAAKRAA